MRIFVGYHFGPNDAWVRDQVYRLVRAFRSEPVNGENLYAAQNLAQGVIDRINECDALIGIASRRNATANGYFDTYPWIQNELTVAQVANKMWVQIREVGLDPALGMHEGRQYIDYDRTQPAECLLRLAEALAEWHAPRDVFVYLLPEAFAAAIRLYLNRPGFISTYEVLNENYEVISQGSVKIVEINRQMQAKLRGVPPLGRFIQFRVSFGADVWVSDCEAVNSRTMTMNKI